jgi:transglutaminase-like putative cysteine protease
LLEPSSKLRSASTRLLWLAPPVFALAFGVSHVRADNPMDAENGRLAQRVSSAGSEPRGAVPLLELWDNWDRSTPRKLVAELTRLSKDTRLSADRRVLVETLLAQARLRLGDQTAVTKRFDELGYVTRFRVIGPFDNEGKAGFDKPTPVEDKRMEAPDLQAQFPGRERPVAWRDLPEVTRNGFVPFGALMRPLENVCGLAETFVKSERARPLTLWVGAGGAVKVYWNGAEVLRDASYRAPTPDRSVAMVGAHAGWNRLLVKVCTTNSSWGFQLRIGDERGAVATGLTTSRTTTAALDIPAHDPKQKLPRTPATALAWFEKQAAVDKPSAALLVDFARYLDLSGSDDPAERRAKQLVERAVDLEAKPEYLRLAAKLSEERAEMMRFAERAYAASPNDPATLLLRASLMARGPAPEAAVPVLDKIPKESLESLDAALLRASLVHDLDLPSSALGELRLLERRIASPVSGSNTAASQPSAAGSSPQPPAADVPVALLRSLVEFETDAGHPDAALRERARLLTLRYDDGDSRRALIDDALERGEKQPVLDQIDVLRGLSPGSVRTLLYVAGVYDALGRDDLALATYRDATAIAPEASNVYVAHGRALLHAQQNNAAIEALQKGLLLKPQDAETRELLESIKPAPRADEAYALASQDVLKRRTNDHTYPYAILQDLTVKTVFENGLGSTFRQLAVQINDAEGARRFRTHSFQYDPDSQHVDLRLSRVYRKDGRELESVRTYEQQLGEPWYRLYYDTRATVVVFPDLEPGDVVEVRYRIDDVAHRNLFADYFGDLHLWQDFVPIAHKEYVLITPEGRSIFANSKNFAGLAHDQKVDNKRRIDRYTAENIPALVAEDGMPGITEESPYLHISTYRTWQDVGRWYWGLIKDQLYADQALKRTVADITSGATTTHDRVVRIHDWVLSHTRYVGLEFGIHGFLPYRVPLIVQRGFGDCKDKASLMYTMLREAGVDARVVLVRTRRNGAIDGEPASLAVFDHAITYVPELDMYLDGTAEHSGTTELPTEDQGVTVLLVGPDGAELRKTPVLSAEQNQRTRTLAVQLEADGSAHVNGAEEVRGAEAAGYRDYYQSEGTRSERFERNLGGIYPGVELLDQRFEELQELEQPVRYSYKIKVPRFGLWDGSELRFSPSALGDLVRNMARSPTRLQPLDLATSSAYVEERQVTLPRGMRLTAIPEGGEVSSAWGKLTLRYAAERDVVKVRTEFWLTRARVAPKEYPDFRRWVEAADQLLRQRVGLQKGEP